MDVSVTKTGLVEPRQQLVELMQSVNFGRFERLEVRKGNPILSPPLRIIREIKFGGENGQRQELGMDDFLLKAQVVELFAYFDELQNGTIAMLEIKHGLPFRMTVEDEAA
jgi:hypothetical protein